jgi:hypothetical protein
LWAIWWWLKEDSKQTDVRWQELDLGFFLALAWFLLIPYHLFKSRGVHGLLGILSFIGVQIVAWACAALLIVLIWY